MVDIIKKYSPVELTDKQAETMDKVCDLLLEKNKVMNLTAIKTKEEAAVLHFADSLYPLVTGYVTGNVIDVGTGGGFPAFPIAICTQCRVTAFDATAKKLDFISETAEKCGITNINTLLGRAEELSHTRTHREHYDTVVSRGVARLSVLCEWCLPYLKMGGYFIAMKGSLGREEAAEAKNAIEILGGETVDIIDYKLGDEQRLYTLVVIKKMKATDTEYPRHNSKIRKQPL